MAQGPSGKLKSRARSSASQKKHDARSVARSKQAKNISKKSAKVRIQKRLTSAITANIERDLSSRALGENRKLNIVKPASASTTLESVKRAIGKAKKNKKKKK